MSSSLIRSSLRSSCHLRWQSTAASLHAGPSKPTQTQTSLPPQKLRALIELYHKSERFITPETLDQTIDNAFILGPSLGIAMFAERDRSRSELNMHIAGRRALAKMGNSQMSEQQRDVDGGLFSDKKSQREMMLQEALYGAYKGRPGLEAVVEEAPRIREMKERDIRS